MARKNKADDKAPAASSLEQALKVLDKVFPKDTTIVKVDPDRLKRTLPHLPTGSIVLDYLIGGTPNRFGVPPCPGLPRGRLMNLYGQPSSGKTTLALTAAAATCARGGKVAFIDWENAIEMAYTSNLGVPIHDRSKFILAQPETLEKGLSYIWTFARAGVDLIIIDSVGAGVPKAIMEQAIEDKGEMGRIGLVAAKWSKILPELQSIVNRSGSCVIGIQQLRKNIGVTGYGPKDTQQGGEAWKFYSAIRMMLRRVKSEKSKVYDPLTDKMVEKVITSQISARIDKCKVSASQGAEATFYIKFGEGIDDVRSIIDVATAHRVIKKAGSWYELTITPEGREEQNIRAQGLVTFKRDLLACEGAWEALASSALAKVSTAALASVDVDYELAESDDALADLDALLDSTPKAGESDEPDAEESDDE